MQITPSDEFFDLNGGHIWILQHFYYKNQKKNLLNLSDQHFLASGLGCQQILERFPNKIYCDHLDIVSRDKLGIPPSIS